MSYTEGKLRHAYRQRQAGMYAEEIFDESGETVATAAWYQIKTKDGFTTNREANARRLVACWNYCVGMSTEHLESGDDWKAEARVLVAHGDMVRAVKHCRAKTGWGLKRAVYEVKALRAITHITNEHDALVKERDELVVELRAFFEKGYSRSRSERIRKLLKKYPEAS